METVIVLSVLGVLFVGCWHGLLDRQLCHLDLLGAGPREQQAVVGTLLGDLRENLFELGTKVPVGETGDGIAGGDATYFS